MPFPRDSFEETTLPACWQAAPGSQAEPSPRHAKDGVQSLRWSWSSGSTLRRSDLGIATASHAQAGMQAWVYCERPLSGRLTFRLGPAGGAAAYEFRFHLGFTGWRNLHIRFASDARPAGAAGALADIGWLEIVPPSEQPAGEIFLDEIVFAASAGGDRSADFQIPEFSGGPGGWCSHWPLLHARMQPSQPLPASMSAAERSAVATIRERHLRWLLGQGDASSPLLAAAAGQVEAYMAKGLATFRAHGVVRAADGTLRGPGLHLGRGNQSFYHVFHEMLLPLAFAWRLRGDAAARDAALLVFDYVHDQGWAEGSACGGLWLNCLMFAPYGHAIALMRDELAASGRLDHAVRAALWFQDFGKTFSRFDEEYLETNADALRSIAFSALVVLANLDEGPRQVQYLRGWLDWIDHALAISPRFAGLIKPDGCGFHHMAHYANAYATCAYEFCTLMAWMLHGTAFALAPQSVANLKHALISQDVISNRYHVPYAAMGRMPYPEPHLLSAYAYLALASEPPDRDLAGIFARLWDPACPALAPLLTVAIDSTDGQFLGIKTPGRLRLMQQLLDRGVPPSPPPSGFWSKPWGGLAIHRRDDWLVSVKGWSQYVWDFEMHPKAWMAVEENVFARFWSHGTLQPITCGTPRGAIASGWNLEHGWDWCRWPGSTTPHLTLREIYDPASSWACRFFSAATFVGAVESAKRDGMFALKLHEHFHEPSFRAYKTYCCVGNEIICLGSNIESRDAAHSVATTLFQSWMPDSAMPIAVDGRVVTAFPWSCVGTAGQAMTILDPYGSGYVIPDGGGLHLERRQQQSRNAGNHHDTSGAFSTCWIDHGTPPRDDGYGSMRYHYAMLVRATPAALAAYAAAPPYRVLRQDHQAHIVEHLGERLIAYALFETDWIIPHGLIRRTDTPVIAMVRTLADGVLLSVADPDLRLPKRRNLGYLDDAAACTPSRPSTVRVHLRGRWRLAEATNDIGFVAEDAHGSIVEVHCHHGATREARLIPA